MKWLIFFFSVLTLALGIALSLVSSEPPLTQTASPTSSPTPGTPRQGKAPPPLVTTQFDGTPFDLAQLRGRGVVVNFWATWCAPCLREMPALERTQAALGDGVRVVAVNLGEPPSSIARFLERQPLSLPILLDANGKIGDAWGVKALPVTFLIDAQGQLVETVMGEKPWDTRPWLDKLRQLGPLTPARAPS